jgi:hypothetical protein
MKLLHESHQLHFFADNNDITPTPLIIGGLLDKLGGFGLLPTLGSELNPNRGDKKQSLSMITSDQKLKIHFWSQDMVILGEGQTQDEFYQECKDIIGTMNTLYPLKLANRVSILTYKFYKGTIEEYENIYKELFTFKAATPFEWDNRIVEREVLAKTKEEINSISSIRRCEISSEFINTGSQEDLIIFEIDSNTRQQNNQPRFKLGNVVDIYDELFDNNKKLTKSLGKYFQ